MRKDIDTLLNSAAASKEGVSVGPPFLHAGSWSRAESLLFSALVKDGRLDAAIDLVKPLTTDDARAVLLHAGFKPGLVADRTLMFSGLKHDLAKSVAAREAAPDRTNTTSVVTQSKVVPSDALAHLQAVLRAKDVEVGLAGTAPLSERGAMMFVAGQAILRKVTGLEVDGVEAKFKMPASVELSDVKELFSRAGGAMAETEVRSAIPSWANGKPPYRFSDLVPENVGRILRGGLSKTGIETVSDALQSGAVRDFGAKQGSHIISQVFEARGVRLDAPSIEDMAAQAGFKVIEPNREKGNYFGAVVASDHRATAIKCSRDSVLVLAHKDLPEGVDRPVKGETMRLKFANGVLATAVTQQSPQVAKEPSGGR